MPAWTTPRTWTIGEFATKAILDTHVRDNSRSLHDMTIVRRTTNIAGTSAYVAIPWDTEDVDEAGIWVIGSPTRFTAPYSGRFEINAITTMTSATGTGEHRMRIRRFTSAGAFIETWGETPTSTINLSVSVYGIGIMNSGDYLEVEQYVGASGTTGQVQGKAWMVGRG